jgi:hypothetical protein
MFSVNREMLNCHHVISEPGDMTRYDFYIVTYYNDSYFFSMKNTFTYPQKINHYDIMAMSREGHPFIIKLADKYKCNPNTVLACVNAVKKIFMED